MAAVAHLSAPQDAVDFPYRAVSRAAIASLVLAVLALIGLIPTFEALLVLALFGIAAAMMGMRAVRRYPAEYSGGAVALTGLMLNLAILVGGAAEHTYIYMTEVPEGYQRVHFYELQQPKNVADGPTSRAIALDGEQIFLKGYIHPASGDGLLKRFVLVPDLGTCCFGGQPRSSDMVDVTLSGNQTIRSGLTRVKLAGKLLVNQHGLNKGDFDNPVFYRLRADLVR